MPKSASAPVNSALSDQRSHTALRDCTTHWSSCPEVEERRDLKREEEDGEIILLLLLGLGLLWTTLLWPVNLFSFMTLYAQCCPLTIHKFFTIHLKSIFSSDYTISVTGFRCGVPLQEKDFGGHWPLILDIKKGLQSVFLLFNCAVLTSMFACMHSCFSLPSLLHCFLVAIVVSGIA